MLRPLASLIQAPFRGPLVRSALRHLESSPNLIGRKSAAIIPPAVPGNLGDCAMISATVEALRERDFDRIDIFGEDWKLDEKVDSQISTSAFFYNASPIQHARLIRNLKNYTHILLVGADVIDGCYNPCSVSRRIELVGLAAEVGKTGVILGSSFNEAPSEDTVDALRKAPVGVVMCARDPLSAMRMRRVLARSIEETADVAFLLRANPDHPDAATAINWIKEQREYKRSIVAINLNYLHMAKRPDLLRTYLDVAKGLIERNCSLLLLPHDTRTAQSDVYWSEALLKELTEESRRKAYLVNTPSAAAVKAILAKVDMLVSGRMHAMILALSSGTPAIGVTYQDKFEGMLANFGLDSAEHTISPDDFLNGGDSLLVRVRRMAEQSAIKRDYILSKLEIVQVLAERNFQW